MTKKFSFPKEERLSSIIRIKEVFNNGNSFFAYPFKAFYKANEEHTSRICINAPKRAFKSAVDRNKIKRRSKEAYRLNKEIIAQSPTLDIYLIFIAKKVENYDTIEKGMKNVLCELAKL